MGGWAFRNCTSLTSVTIGKGVNRIAEYAFTECDNLKTVTLENIENWGYSADSLDGADCYIIPSTELADTSTAATYLRLTLSGYNWYKK